MYDIFILITIIPNYVNNMLMLITASTAVPIKHHTFVTHEDLKIL